VLLEAARDDAVDPDDLLVRVDESAVPRSEHGARGAHLVRVRVKVRVRIRVRVQP